jgi:thiol-disulfide isomerase/thioredoxin
MKKLLFLLFPLAVSAQSGIQFQNLSWEAALKKASETNKLIFLDAYATWCGPCKTIEKYTFTDAKVGAYFNANFINMRLDMEDYPGVELAELYDVVLYPTLLFINGKGELVHRGCGAVQPEDLLQLGREATSPGQNLKSLQDKVLAGAREKQTVDAYFTVAESACLDIEKIIRELFKTSSDEQLASPENWHIIRAYVTNVYSREFQVLLKNRNRFLELNPVNEVEDKIFDTFMATYFDLNEAGDFTLFGIQSLQFMASQVEFARKKELLDFLDFGYGELSGDWEVYARGAVSFIDPAREDLGFLLDVCWKFYLFVNDKERLLKALNWTKHALENNDPSPAAIDTYASLLFKVGRVKEAIQFEMQALELAKSWGEPTQHYEYQLTKFKKP